MTFKSKFEEEIPKPCVNMKPDLDSFKVRGAFNEFPDFFWKGIYNCRRLVNIQYVIAIHLMRRLTNFYDFRFKLTATSGIGIHPTKA